MSNACLLVLIFFTLQGRGWVKRKEENEGFVLESSVFTTLSVLSDALFASCGPINWLRVNVNEARDKNTNTQIQIKLQDVPQSTPTNKAEHTNTSSPECFVKFDDRFMERKELKMPTRHPHPPPPSSSSSPSSPLKAYSVCVSLLVVHIASLWNQNLNHDVFQTLGSSSVDELPPELREKAQKSNRKAGIENGDCIEKNLLERNLVGSLLPLFPALSDSSRLLVHICTSAQAQNLCKDSKSNCASSAYLHDLRLRIFVSGAHLHRLRIFAKIQNQIFIHPQTGWFP